MNYNIATAIDPKNRYFYKYFSSYIDDLTLVLLTSDGDSISRFRRMLKMVDKDPILKKARGNFKKLETRYNKWSEQSAEALSLIDELKDLDDETNGRYKLPIPYVDALTSWDDDGRPYIRYKTGCNNYREQLKKFIDKKATTPNFKRAKDIVRRLDKLLSLIYFNVLNDELKTFTQPIREILNDYTPEHVNKLLTKSSIQKEMRAIEFNKIKHKIYQRIARKLNKHLDDEYENAIVLDSIYKPRDGDWDDMIHYDYDGTLTTDYYSSEYVADRFKNTIAKYVQLKNELNKVSPAIKFSQPNPYMATRDKDAICALSFEIECKNKTITEKNLKDLEEILGKI